MADGFECDEAAGDLSPGEPESTNRSVFPDLPPELRTMIYEYAAGGTPLRLIPSSPKRLPTSPPGLLLASRQTREEYLPNLLVSATITTGVHYFYLDRLWGSLSNLQDAKQESLRSNSKGLTIRISLDNAEHVATCHRKHRGNGPHSLVSVRRWLERIVCTPELKEVAWRYEVDWPEPWHDYRYCFLVI